MAEDRTVQNIESMVTRLLILTKELLEALNSWSRGTASEDEVSNVYVSLGNEFNLVCRSFLDADIGVMDLGDVPQLLRVVLEKALAEEASEEALDRYLPQIREIIVTLLRQLTHKKALLRQRQLRPRTPRMSRTPSASSENRASPGPRRASDSHSQTSQVSQPHAPPHSAHGQNAVPHSAAHSGHSAVGHSASGHSREPQPQHMQQQPNMHAHQHGSTRGMNQAPSRSSADGSGAGSVASASSGGPRTDEGNAFAALQRSEALERRASKRYSQYHMSKINNGAEQTLLPTLAPHISFPADYTDATVVDESSRRLDPVSETTGDEHSGTPTSPPMQAMARRVSTKNRSSSGRLRKSPNPALDTKSLPPRPDGQTDEAPGGAAGPTVGVTGGPGSSGAPAGPGFAGGGVAAGAVAATTSVNGGSATSDVAVFLRLGDRVRKSHLEPPPSLAAIRLKFVEIFAFTPTVGEIFPDMTIQDADTGIDYELTEATVGDVREGSLLTLAAPNAQTSSLDKKVDDLTAIVRELSDRLDSKGRAGSTGNVGMPRPPFAQQQQPQPQSRGGSVSAPGPYGSTVRRGSPSLSSGPSTPGLSTPMAAGKSLPAVVVDELRQDIAAMRQISGRTITALRSEITSLHAQTASLMTANPGSNRSYMQKTHQRLNEESDGLLKWVEDLQDIVENQRKDVAERSFQIDNKQLERVARELNRAKDELATLSTFVTNGEPRWRKIWEHELSTVVEEQQFFQMQVDLVKDMEADLLNAQETFDLVERCSAELARNARPKPLTLPPPDPEGPRAAMDRVLTDVMLIQPDSAARVEAIERTERLRKRELAMRGDDFSEELDSFVSEGKLKMAGGVEEAERRRRERDEVTRAEAQKSEQEAKEARRRAKEERKRAKELEQEQAPVAPSDLNIPGALPTDEFADASSGPPGSSEQQPQE